MTQPRCTDPGEWWATYRAVLAATQGASKPWSAADHIRNAKTHADAAHGELADGPRIPEERRL